MRTGPFVNLNAPSEQGAIATAGSKSLRRQQVLSTNLIVFRRSCIMLSAAMALPTSGGAPSEARADLKTEEVTSESEGTISAPEELSWLLFASSYYLLAHRARAENRISRY